MLLVRLHLDYAVLVSLLEVDKNYENYSWDEEYTSWEKIETKL